VARAVVNAVKEGGLYFFYVESKDFVENGEGEGG